MSSSEIIKKVFTKTLSESIGLINIEPIVYLGKPSSSVAYKLPKEKNPTNALIQGEFLRYVAQKELLSFICIAVKAHAMKPKDMMALTDLQRAELMENNGDGFLKHPKTMEILQLHCETPHVVEFQSYEIVRGVGNMITNLKLIEDFTTKGTIDELELGSPISDLFRGQKTNLLDEEPHIQDQFNSKIRNLMSL